CLDDLLERDGGAGRRVELGGVVRFADRERVAIEPRQFGGEAEHLLHADGKVRPIEQGTAASMRQFLHRVQVRIPAGGADHDAAAEGQHGVHVFHGRVGGGEVDDGIDAGEGGGGERGGTAVFMDLEGAHAVAAFAGDFSDERAGFAFTEDEKEHDEILADRLRGARVPILLFPIESEVSPISANSVFCDGYNDSKNCSEKGGRVPPSLKWQAPGFLREQRYSSTGAEPWM